MENEKKFLWLVEQEKFRNNIETLQRISQELARAETRSLRIMLNKTALKLGLEPLLSRKNDR